MQKPEMFLICAGKFRRFLDFCRANLHKVLTRIVPGPVRERWGRLLQPLCLLLVVFFCGQVAWIYYGLKPSAVTGQAIRLDVPRGSSVKEVGRLLEREGLIRNSNSFVWYVYLTGKVRAIKAGRYQLTAGMPFAKIFSELQQGRPVYHRVTIPEGLTQKEITELLAKRGLIDKERFETLLSDRDFLFTYLEEFKPRSAEGFLFPDTYDFADEASEEEILGVFFRRFLQVWNEIAPTRTGGNLSPLQVVILASIIEREAKKEEERPIIAAVFLNRLRLGYPLQSCATVMYALGERKARLLYEDLKVESPYNTYLYRGLPPGPISSPGRASLAAALRPADTDYLYFVARPDGSHSFSRTYREHLRAQRELRTQR
ncbi:MAG: endolytic transglycosylase MltG [Firmicutes bacterium]|nr:endolytic transglycosylase MltG [Bacillota bacterium]